MRISNIAIDGFGVLSNFRLTDIPDGLTVLHGINGSGKTTLLHFLRGMLGGFADARRLKLLPPLKGGNPGGSVTVHYGQGQYEIIRRFRADHSDTLAIQRIQGNTNEADALRHEVETIDGELLRTVLAVGGFEAHALDALVRLALRDGIDLSTKRHGTTWMAGRVDEIIQEREALLKSTPSDGRIAELERELSRLASELQAAQLRQEQHQSRWANAISQLRKEIDRLQRAAHWSHVELQQAQADLTEVNDRLWSRREHVVYETQQVPQPVERISPAWVEEIRAIDAEIAHAQQVLRDLASSRMLLSLSKAQLTGTETPDQEAVFARHRAAINEIEQQTERLQGVLQRIHDADRQQQCVCGELRTTIGGTLESIRLQISLLCQELSRQQAAHEQFLIVSKRDGVDRCEMELTRQIQRLRMRRDELVHHQDRPMQERVQFCTVHEVEHCECEQHRRFVRALPKVQTEVRQAPEIITTERVVTSSNARATDPAAQRELESRIPQLYRQWQETLQRLRRARTEYRQLEMERVHFATDQQVQKLRYQYNRVEQQLADAREQWQSLAVLQTVLQRTQEQLRQETVSPVIEEASHLLRRMTEGRYPAFRYHADSRELIVVNEHGNELTMAALSRGTLDQAALSFRMALWAEYARRGVKFPLILDDVLPDSDEARLQAAATALVDFSRKHRQLLFFTCQEYLANLFETMGVHVRDFPGSERQHHGSLQRTKAVVDIVTPPAARFVETAIDLDESAPVPMKRVQPDEPYWLQTDSPASYVPSLGAQLARRLGALGVRQVSDLIELDPETTEVPLESLQISATTLRNWQAEARLLCCVPDLTARDAQLLVACSIMSPAELAEVDALDLGQRIRSVRAQQRTDASWSWLSERPEWPDGETVSRWIRRGRKARSYRQAYDWTQRRRTFNRSTAERSDRDRTVTPRHTSAFRHVSSTDTRQHGSSERAPATSKLASALSLPSIETAVDTAWKFFLNMDSPVVDAPSIGPKTAERLEAIGVMTVADLIHRNATEIATRLNRNRITAEHVQQWQQQATLVCRIPQLRGHDAQVLVAVGVTEAEEVANFSPTELYDIVRPFVKSKEGQRLLRSAKTPDLEEVSEWILYAQNSRHLRAA